MAPQWQAPDDWQKDGSSISGVTTLKTGAWTSMLAAKESRQGRDTDVVIKTFSVPQDVLQDPDRISREREKFVAAAYLQKQLSDDPSARAWVDILRVSNDPNNTSFSMKKYGASLQDMLDRHVFLSAKDLFDVTLCVLMGLEELFQKHKRSHGSLKASDILANLPGQQPPYLLSDPSAKGADHSANDLYSLGLILYELIEHKQWDPLTPIIPTKNWARFGGRRDRWMQFLNMLLSPNGCHDSLAQVRKEALRLKPSSGTGYIVAAAAALVIFAGLGVVAWHFVPILIKRVNPPGPAPGPVVQVPSVDPQVKADWEKAHKSYQDLFEKWTARDRTQRYDHTKSVALAQASRAMVADLPLTDAAAYKAATDNYNKATPKLQEAIDACVAEEKAGKALDDEALVDFQKAQQELNDAKSAWDSASSKFSARRDHTKSTAFAQATQIPAETPPIDAAGRHSAAAQLRSAAARYNQAIAMGKEEELAGQSTEQVQAAYQDARSKYLRARNLWDAGAVGISFDISAAKSLADQAQGLIPDQVVLNDAASYQKAGDQYTSASLKLQQALDLLDKTKKEHNQVETDATTALARATDAMSAKDYATAFGWFTKAANQGNAQAMFNVGYLYETGHGTDKDDSAAASWYLKAADKNYTAAMVNLGLLYERGRGVSKDYNQAIALYKKAAALNDTSAMRNLAYLYENGLGVEKDPQQSIAWYKKAAGLKDPAALFQLGVIYEQGKGVATDYPQAITCYQKAADLNYARAMNELGVLYDTGRGVSQDPVKAMTWYKKAADLNYAPAMCNIGSLYDHGAGVPLDHAEALRWFQKGADLGHAMSMYNLAVLYETGRGIPKPDLGTALDWYRKAAKSDDELAKKQAIDRLDALGFTH